MSVAGMGDGAFSQVVRRALMVACEGRCVGCGATSPTTLQHRRARGMGGTSSTAVGSPANALVLCGSGTTGCHGWAEAHPVEAELLGWRLAPGVEADGAPWWHRFYGWVCWRVDETGFLTRGWMDDGEVDRFEARKAAVASYRAVNVRVG